MAGAFFVSEREAALRLQQDDLLMSNVTNILSAIEQGDGEAAERLLPLIYDELRKLAAAKMAQEKPGQTLQATALVHEAYVRLVGSEEKQNWDGRTRFFAAAAEAIVGTSEFDPSDTFSSGEDPLEGSIGHL